MPAWWQKHRPLLMQTASLGPMDINQRKDLEVNPTEPSPPNRGMGVISVRDNMIAEIRHVTAQTLAGTTVLAEAVGA